MEVCTSQLELQFSRIVSDLNIVQHTLESEFARKYPTNVDPLRLMYRLERLREEIPILQERAERLALAKREQLSECAGAFRESYGVLQHLLEVSGLPTDTDRENSGYTCSSDSSAKSCVEDIEKMLQMVSSHLDECLGDVLRTGMSETQRQRGVLSSHELERRLLETEMLVQLQDTPHNSE